MQANWSLILNVLLLIGVIVAIGRMMKTRLKNSSVVISPPSIGQASPQVSSPSYDDIIAVRKVKRELPPTAPVVQSIAQPAIQPFAQPAVHAVRQPVIQAAPVSKYQPVVSPPQPVMKLQPESPSQPVFNSQPVLNSAIQSTSHAQPISAATTGNKIQVEKSANTGSASSLMMFLLAKENRQLAGYELLQTVLATGLRFGEGHLFHRHQQPNGQGPVLCSLAAATASGVFDLQNIGAFSVHGLCLFMQASGNPTIDAERFAIMLDTAKQLSEGLDTYLLDDKRQTLTEASVQRYYRLLNLSEACEETALA